MLCGAYVKHTKYVASYYGNICTRAWQLYTLDISMLNKLLIAINNWEDCRYSVTTYETFSKSDVNCKTFNMKHLKKNTYHMVVYFQGFKFCGLGSYNDFMGSYFCGIPPLITQLYSVSLWIRRHTKSTNSMKITNHTVTCVENGIANANFLHIMFQAI